MALKKTIIYKTINLPDAYLRVVCPQFDLTKKTMSFGVWAFASQDAAGDWNNSLDGAATTYADVPYDMAGANAYEQAYTHLKSLPDFAGAVDVLEVGQPS
ncbi:hypothetical protein F3J20_22505 [Paraburkholderia sp. Cy-641]|uniref:hypothetical protein n=1 Tax=Paraburkholderia sp. Cy-641 TaxID=2608337 RepID=UPI00141DCDAA|nr:hypothetical protein [Paraburkholderia sp. Cy-641]NIF80129.1 hypothetical protein [Paraburkholderia sp. Cy-641]